MNLLYSEFGTAVRLAQDKMIYFAHDGNDSDDFCLDYVICSVLGAYNDLFSASSPSACLILSRHISDIHSFCVRNRRSILDGVKHDNGSLIFPSRLLKFFNSINDASTELGNLDLVSQRRSLVVKFMNCSINLDFVQDDANESVLIPVN